MPTSRLQRTAETLCTRVRWAVVPNIQPRKASPRLDWLVTMVSTSLSRLRFSPEIERAIPKATVLVCPLLRAEVTKDKAKSGRTIPPNHGNRGECGTLQADADVGSGRESVISVRKYPMSF